MGLRDAVEGKVRRGDGCEGSDAQTRLAVRIANAAAIRLAARGGRRRRRRRGAKLAAPSGSAPAAPLPQVARRAPPPPAVPGCG